MIELLRKTQAYSLLQKECAGNAVSHAYLLLFNDGRNLRYTLKEFAKYADKESIQLLNWAININENEVEQLYNNQSYHLCVTMYEYWISCCTKQNIRYEAKKLLSKIKDQ